MHTPMHTLGSGYRYEVANEERYTRAMSVFDPISRRFTPPPARALLATCAVLAFFSPGCATTAPIVAFAQPSPPEDFWLSVTVQGPQRATGYAMLARSDRPARYVVEADRVLRAAVGPGASENRFPPQTRTLSDEQFARVWRVLRESSIVRDQSATMVSTMPTLDTAPTGTSIIISYVANGLHEAHVIPLSETPSESPTVSGFSMSALNRDARAIADTLAELSWQSEAVTSKP